MAGASTPIRSYGTGLPKEGAGPGPLISHRDLKYRRSTWPKTPGLRTSQGTSFRWESEGFLGRERTQNGRPQFGGAIAGKPETTGFVTHGLDRRGANRAIGHQEDAKALLVIYSALLLSRIRSLKNWRFKNLDMTVASCGGGCASHAGLCRGAAEVIYQSGSRSGPDPQADQACLGSSAQLQSSGFRSLGWVSYLALTTYGWLGTAVLINYH
jgi:hypothetical protein